jgi:F-type H+-transporting ATPase subunit gamma
LEKLDSLILNNPFLKASFNEGKISSVEIIHNRFVSMIKSQVTQTKLIPFITEEQAEQESKNQAESHKSSNGFNDTILFEPSVLDLVQTLIPLYCKNQIHQALLLARASELSNRVNAMGAATDNAKALMNQLTLSYNKARQASITQEIAEIVSGAESLK